MLIERCARDADGFIAGVNEIDCRAFKSSGLKLTR